MKSNGFDVGFQFKYMSIFISLEVRKIFYSFSELDVKSYRNIYGIHIEINLETFVI